MTRILARKELLAASTLIAFMAVLLPASPISAAQVYVRATENGQGVTRGRGVDCFVITPEHVLLDAFEIEVSGYGGVRASGWQPKSFPEDVGLIQLDQGGSVDCSEPWPEGSGLTALLERALNGRIRSIDGFGARRNYAVHIAGFDTQRIYVTPVQDKAEFFKGLSGSLLEIEGVRGGMLMSYDPDRREGTVLRQDYLSDLVRRFFAVGAQPAPQQAVAPSSTTEAPVRAAPPAVEPQTQQQAALPPSVAPAEPLAQEASVALDPVSGLFIFIKNANIRAGPDAKTDKVGFAAAGRLGTVQGKVRGKNWYRIDLGDGTLGYVYAPLVEAIDGSAPSTAMRSAPSPKAGATVYNVLSFKAGARDQPELTVLVRQRLERMPNAAVIAGDPGGRRYDYQVTGRVLRADEVSGAASGQVVSQILGALTGLRSTTRRTNAKRYEAEVAIEVVARRTGYVTTERGFGRYEDFTGTVYRNEALTAATRQAVEDALHKITARLSGAQVIPSSGASAPRTVEFSPFAGPVFSGSVGSANPEAEGRRDP